VYQPIIEPHPYPSNFLDYDVPVDSGDPGVRGHLALRLANGVDGVVGVDQPEG
jgi:hypothetical protein